MIVKVHKNNVFFIMLMVSVMKKRMALYTVHLQYTTQHEKSVIASWVYSQIFGLWKVSINILCAKISRVNRALVINFFTFFAYRPTYIKYLSQGLKSLPRV